MDRGFTVNKCANGYLREKRLSVAKIVASTSVDGPGLRTSLYLQGCPIQCPGCHNEALWDINGGESRSVEDVAREMIETDENISILGGEPLMQYEALVSLCTILNGFSEKSIWLWTGYDWRYVKKHYPKIIDLVDVIVAGPFIKEKMVHGQWFGSSNQQIIVLTRRGEKECLMRWFDPSNQPITALTRRGKKRK